jgi:hypothetical protein
VAVGQCSCGSVAQAANVWVPTVEASLPAQLSETAQLEAQLDGVAPATQCVVHDE